VVDICNRIIKSICLEGNLKCQGDSFHGKGYPLN
jgi:hypothetical protein